MLSLGSNSEKATQTQTGNSEKVMVPPAQLRVTQLAKCPAEL